MKQCELGDWVFDLQSKTFWCSPGSKYLAFKGDWAKAELCGSVWWILWFKRVNWIFSEFLWFFSSYDYVKWGKKKCLPAVNQEGSRWTKNGIDGQRQSTHSLTRETRKVWHCRTTCLHCVRHLISSKRVGIVKHTFVLRISNSYYVFNLSFQILGMKKMLVI